MEWPGGCNTEGHVPVLFSFHAATSSKFYFDIIIVSHSHLRQSFEQVLQLTDLPEPGPGYYEARRRLWLTPLPDLPSRQTPSPAQQKFEDLLNQPNAIHNIKVWNNALGRFWRSLSSGRKLKSNLPMNLIVCISCPFLDPLHLLQDQDHTRFVVTRRNMASWYGSSFVR